MDTGDHNSTDTSEAVKLSEIISDKVPSADLEDDKNIHLEDKDSQPEFETQVKEIDQEDIQQTDRDSQEENKDVQLEDKISVNTQIQNENKNKERDTESPELEIIMVEPGRGRKRRRQRHFKGIKNQNEGESETDKYGRVVVEGRSRSVSSSGSSYYSSSRSDSSDGEERKVGLRVSILQPASPGGNTDMFGRNIPRDQPRSRSNSSGSDPSRSKSPSTKSKNPIKLTLKTVSAETDDVTYVISSESDTEVRTSTSKDNAEDVESIGL